MLIVYIVNPNNPTGSFVSISKLIELTKIHNDTLFVIDEVYYEFVGQSISNFAVTVENIIVTRTFSKAFALASFRSGYVIASKNNVQRLKKIRNPKNISTLSQIAAEAAPDSVDYMLKYVDDVSKAKEYFVSRLSKINEITLYPSVANFVMLRFNLLC
ncbi:MAG TPA: histidinol-phosphate aminotransferase family protein [Ignavibacteria bacterium]|nr:histidinol-phosphate aminotransferase family protein [Ignavibacteria bacterium]